MEQDRQYMKMALELAQKGMGFTAPNPMVGAVIVKNGRIIGQGYHRKYGELHAEREALAACTEEPEGASIYVTLEPCCHYGKQPPCVNAILEAGIRRVIIGSSDPNPLSFHFYNICFPNSILLPEIINRQFFSCYHMIEHQNS